MSSHDAFPCSLLRRGTMDSPLGYAILVLLVIYVYVERW